MNTSFARQGALAMALALLPLPLLAQSSNTSSSRSSNQSSAAKPSANYAEEMHRAHQHESPTASGAARIAPRNAVTGESVVYATIGGKQVRGYLSTPTNYRGGPAIVMVHEWWGLNDNIKAMADRYAGEGYAVLAVDLFGGEVATAPAAAMKLYQAGMSNIAAGEQNVAAAVQYLRGKGATKVGSVGYCFGGHWSLRTGLAAGASLNAVAIYYGAPITDATQLGRLKAPVLGLFGGQDKGIPVDSVRAMEAQLKKLGRPVTIEVYANADHAFANPSGQAYNATAAEDAWKKTLAFFAANLR